MKKIEIEKAITSYLSRYNYNFVDALNHKYTIKSNKDIIYIFTLIKTTFENTIIEYVNESQSFLDKLSNFINSCKTETIENLNNYIESNFNSMIGFNYTRSIQLKSIHPESFSTKKEASKEAFENIYTELGYASLQHYIQLVQSPATLSSFLSTNDERQIVAMKFILFKTNHHSPEPLIRDNLAPNIYESASQHIHKTITEITSEKDEFITYMKEQKENYDTWIINTEKEFNDFKNTHTQKLFDIEQTYKAKLRVEEPANFMKKQADKYFISTFAWCIVIFGVFIFLMFLLAALISPEIIINDKLITINIFNQNMPIYTSLIIVALISLSIYILRIFIKLAISSKHLMEEYKQKYSLTYFYLSLINDGKIKDEKALNIILTSLFTKADTGLIKNDTSNDLEKILLFGLQKQQ